MYKENWFLSGASYSSLAVPLFTFLTPILSNSLCTCKQKKNIPWDMFLLTNLVALHTVLCSGSLGWTFAFSVACSARAAMVGSIGDRPRSLKILLQLKDSMKRFSAWMPHNRDRTFTFTFYTFGPDLRPPLFQYFRDNQFHSNYPAVKQPTFLIRQVRNNP